MPFLYLKLISVCLHRFSADTVGACHLPEQSALLHQVSATSWSVCALWECVNFFHHRLEGWVTVGVLSLWQMDMTTVYPCGEHWFSTRVWTFFFFFLTKLYWNRLFIALFNRLWLAAFILDHFPLFTSRWRVGAIHNGGLKCCYQKVGERTKRTQLKLGDVYQMSTYEHARKLSQSVSKRRYTHRHTVAGAAVSYCRSNCLPYLRTCIHVPGLKGSLSQHHMFLTDFSQLAILRKCKYQQPHCEKCTVNRE